jgi:hypothetical protein
MATATKRRVQRDAQAKLKKELGKVSKRVRAEASLDAIKRDADVLANNRAYEARERGPESMVQWVTGVVKLFADPKKNFGVNDKTARYFVKEEARIRSLTRRDKLATVSERDKRGVSGSQFLSVLKMAKTAGGAAMWQRCTNVGSNWTLSQELATKARAQYKKSDDKWPTDKWLTSTLAAIKTRKRGNAGKSGGNKGGIKLGAPALAARMLKDAREFKSRLRRMMIDTGSETIVQGLIRNAETLAKRVKEHAAKIAKAEQAAKDAA